MTYRLYTCTPFQVLGSAMARSLFNREGDPLLARSDYRSRQDFVSYAASPEEAASETWNVFQNLDAGHRTPDGLRSLAVGDLVRVVDEEGNTTWFRTLSLGFEQVDPTWSE